MAWGKSTKQRRAVLRRKQAQWFCAWRRGEAVFMIVGGINEPGRYRWKRASQKGTT